jgi:hypothetical protein
MKEVLKIDGLHQPMRQPRNGVLVRAGLGAHGYEKSAQQLNAGVLVKAASLENPVVLVRREPVQLREIKLDGHRSDAIARPAAVTPTSSPCRAPR